MSTDDDVWEAERRPWAGEPGDWLVPKSDMPRMKFPDSSRDNLAQAIRESVERVYRMPLEEREKMWAEQRASWVRGQMAMGSDADEARGRQRARDMYHYNEASLSRDVKAVIEKRLGRSLLLGEFVEVPGHMMREALHAPTPLRDSFGNDLPTPGEWFAREGEARRGPWMRTFTGRKFWPLDPRAEDFRLADIAVSLAFQNRYRGHMLGYSVAQHCVLLHDYAEQPVRWPALMHEIGEPYIGDFFGPLKSYFPDICDMEHGIEIAAAGKYGLPVPWPARVKELDADILVDEQTQRMRCVEGGDPTFDGTRGPGLGITINPWSAQEAFQAFRLRVSRSIPQEVMERCRDELDELWTVSVGPE